MKETTITVRIREDLKRELVEVLINRGHTLTEWLTAEVQEFLAHERDPLDVEEAKDRWANDQEEAAYEAGFVKYEEQDMSEARLKEIQRAAKERVGKLRVVE
jgi:antitoxin component of RelBE/YafQ-DinJ toxin-antitoxin module